MKLLLPLMLLLAPLSSFSQQRYLVSSRGDAIPLRRGESSLQAAQRIGLVSPEAACTGEATFGYTPGNYPATTTHIGFHNDIIGVWFLAPADGSIDSVFWFQGAGVCTQDSQLVLRLFKSNIYPGHGPGYGGYPAASTSTCWGYWANTNDMEDGVAAFPEDATGGWTSTVVGGPGPSYPPVDSAIWGLSGVNVDARPNQVNSAYLLPLLGVGGVAPTLHIGDPFFMTLKIQGTPSEPCCGTCGNTANTGFLASGDTDEVHSHNWKFYENVVTFQAGFDCKGWVARGDFNVLFWYVMTATSNLPPSITIDDRVRTTTSTLQQTVAADIIDCDPANPARAGVQTATVKYSINGGAFTSAGMDNIGADRWEGTIPGVPKGSTVSYRIVSSDSLGVADSSVLSTYRVVDLNSPYYRCDTALACTPISIVGTGTVIDTSQWFLPLHTTTTTTAHAGDDGTAGPYSLGGPFIYFGDTMNYAWVSVDGAIALTKTAAETLDVNANGFATDSWDLPNRQYHGRSDTGNQQAGFMPKNLIAPYWADWIVKQDSPLATFGHIRYQVSGNKFIVEWDSAGDFDQNGPILDNDKFRVVLDRSAGTIQFQYDDIGVGGLDTVNLIGINSDSTKHPGPTTPFNYFNKDGFPSETHIHSGLCVTYYPKVYEFSIADGWNMVSVGCIPPSYAKSFLFPTAVSNNGFGYNGGYLPTQTFKNGPGYWLKFLGSGSIDGPGLHLTSVDDSLNNGWNMVGSVSTPVAVGTLTTTPPGITTSPYFGFGGSYTVASTLSPGRGYWVKTNAAGTLHIVGTGAVPKTVPEVAELAALSKVTISDKLNRAQTLYIGSDAALSAQAASRYEMPPAAPDGALNVRFATGRMVEVYPSVPEAGKDNSYAITIQGAVYPLTVKWESARGSAQQIALLALNGKDTKTLGIVEGTGKVTINDAGVTKLALKVTEGLAVPKEFALSQNYPNPFNPTTHFSVDIPKASSVDITVYDVLGRRITTLMSGEQEAGYHIMEWDSKDSHGLAVPSGMYMVRMTAADFSAVRKVMLMK